MEGTENFTPPEAEQVVDPAVSRAKFDSEVAAYRALQEEYRRRGMFLIEAEFPKVFAIFASPKLIPAPIAFGIVLDFTNYDLWPPSVRLVHPFTKEPYKANELPTRLPRMMIPTLPPELAAQGVVAAPQAQDMVVDHGSPGEIPFLCLPGVREYHDHPAHTGDAWLLHRGRGEGTLHHILNVLFKYGVEPLQSYQIGFNIIGLVQGAPPQ
jgi:hypothetical protein